MSVNTNLIHNVLNVVSLIVGVLVTIDWTTMGLDPKAAAAVAGGVLIAQNVIKLGINITRDGLAGLAKNQPPVQ